MNTKQVEFSFLTAKQAEKLNKWKVWGEKMTLARQLLDEARAKLDKRESLYGKVAEA